MHAMINAYEVLTCSVCLAIDDGVRVCGAPGEGYNFQLEGLKIEF